MSFSACIRYRTSLLASSFSFLPALSTLPRTGPSISRRLRHGGQSKPKRTEQYTRPRNQHNSWSGKHTRHNEISATEGPPTCQAYEDIPAYFQKAAIKWADDSVTRRRLFTFGIPQDQINPLLKWYARAVQQGELTSTPELISRYTLERVMQPLDRRSLDIICSTVFTQYVSELPETALLTSTVPPDVLIQLKQVAEASERMFPAEEFYRARAVQRKIIMHVGPTNSGKTYHALRALAAAPRGVYAGPLRLLAHEIWDRLNNGMICPLGMNPDAPPPPTLRDALAEEDADSSALDLPPVRPHKGNPLWVRECNMLTGEERKIVSEDAELLSCTVEMLSKTTVYDVAVIDEIQLISDPQRGFAWTEALLGVVAREVHLCGEETAVPLVQELLRDTGDEVIINRYERLTPLTVEEHSLGGDWKKVQKGDCVVAFSRSGIFAIKAQIEKTTGMKCAIVYGKLPPEIRSEQAALFNDPDSGYDVIVGSDAIGMGLNLKIRRVIFDSVSKRTKTGFEKLSVSAVKQIAGRAGRFGMGLENGGFTTTFKEMDLDFLRKTLVLQPAPLRYACLGVSETTFSKLAAVLPIDASTATIYDAHVYAGRIPHNFRYTNIDLLNEMSSFVDERASLNGLTTAERIMFMNSPVSWRDDDFLEGLDLLLRDYRFRGKVDFMKALQTSKYPAVLSSVQRHMTKIKNTRNAKEGRSNSNYSDMLLGLETYHKLTVLYMWMFQRNPVVWPQGEEVDY
ncbi:P-loop containing nucleoside triphosphate hydrolase protein [Cyathus striatus]|nr:P-loop containing nucleoside triphosphate hydrolase protein [Cyathus striatus]